MLACSVTVGGSIDETEYAVAIATLAGIAIGGVAVQALHAQGRSRRGRSRRCR
jgi:hypothetical protein